MKWTIIQPTDEGYYWLWVDEWSSSSIVMLWSDADGVWSVSGSEIDGGTMLVSAVPTGDYDPAAMTMWAGPLEEPSWGGDR